MSSRTRFLLQVLGAGFLSFVGLAHAATRPAWTTSRLTTTPEPPSPYELRPIRKGLVFDHPVDIQRVPGTSQFYVLQQNGELWALDPDPAKTNATLVIDIRKHYRPLDNALGFAFHPRFQENHHLFINYNEPGGAPEGSIVSRFTIPDPASPKIDPGSEIRIIRWLSGGHNGCQLVFGPDGFLYISTGDAAPPDPPDTLRTGQRNDDLLSSVLRIDVDRPSPPRPYSIPADNPFVRNEGIRPEVWAYGFRNPWRMSFAPDGSLWVGDVGWELWELVHVIRKGGHNGGWSLIEGPHKAPRSDVVPGPTPVIEPWLSLSHHEAASVTGGLHYRGRNCADLRGQYVFGDWETGRFWAVAHEGDKLIARRELCDTTMRPIAFAEDNQGELVMLDYNGGLYEFHPRKVEHDGRSFPRRLSETGLFRDTAGQESSEGVRPYGIHAPMWSDHALVERWIAAPGVDPVIMNWVDTANTSERARFPSNSVFARTISMEMTAGNPTTRRRLETQVLRYDGQSWHAYTYKWNSSQSDAELVPAEGAMESLTINDAQEPGGRREQTWRYHSRTECMRCHNPWAGNAIAFNFEQLALGKKGDAPSPFVELVQDGWITVANAPTDLHALVDPHDVSQPAVQRARSWLHVNCSHCHRFGAGGSVLTLLNTELQDVATRTLDSLPIRGGFGLPDARVVARGQPYRSTLFHRISTEGAGRMPHLGSRIRDDRGISAVRDWIRDMTPSNPPPAAITADARLGALVEDARRMPSDASTDRLKPFGDSPAGALIALNEFPAGSRRLLASLARSAADPLARDLLQSQLPAAERRKTLGDDFQPSSILGLKGDSDRGRAVYHAETGPQCARCHGSPTAVSGRTFGPPLAGISKKYDPARLLEQIVHPSTMIAPEYVTHVITTRDDSTHVGFLLRRDDREVSLVNEALAEVTLRRGDILRMETAAGSAMPEGLLQSLTAQEAADLLAYLASLEAR